MYHLFKTKSAFFKKRYLCLKLLDLMSAENIGKISDNMELNVKGKGGLEHKI